MNTAMKRTVWGLVAMVLYAASVGCVLFAIWAWEFFDAQVYTNPLPRILWNAAAMFAVVFVSPFMFYWGLRYTKRSVQLARELRSSFPHGATIDPGFYR